MFEALFGEDKGLSALLEPGGDGGPKVGPRPTPKPDGKAKDGAADPKQAGVAMAFWADHPEEALKQLPPEKRMEAIYQLPEDQRGRAQEAMVELQQKEIASRERQEALARLGEDEDAHEAHEGAVKALSEASPEEREQLLGDLPPEKRALAEEAAAEARAREEAEVEADKKKSEEKERLSALAEEKAAEIAKLAASAGKKEGWEDKYSIGGAVDFEKENLDAAIKELPAEIRGEVLKKLQARAEGEDAELSGEAFGLAKESIDALNAKEAQEKRWKEMEEKSISTGVAEAEKAVGDESGKQMKSALKEMSLSEEKKALERMTPEARAAAEDAIAKRREKLTKAAETLSKAREGKGLTDGTDEGAIFKTLAGLTPKEAEELQEIYGELYKDEEGKPRRLKHDLYDELDEDGEKADRDYVRAVLDGDDDAKELGVEAAVRYIENEVDALLDTDESGINDLLRAHCTDQAAMDRIAEAYQKKTGKSLDKELKAVMDSDEYKEASAYERGDKRSANVAVIEGGDPERADQVVDEVSEEPGGMKELCQDVQNHTGMKPSEALKGAVSEEKMAEVEAEVKSAELENEAKRDEKLKAGLAELEKDPAKLADANIRMEKLASKLAGQLSNIHVVGNNFDVTNLIADLGAGEVALLQQHFKAHSLDGKGDLETALREKLSGKDLKVANAVMSGDNVLVAVARVEQAADGTGTDVDAWRKAMEALTDPKDRERFKELMDQHVGGVKGSGYADTVKGELSSHDRDEMEALAIEDENERVGTLAAVRASKNAYGGKYAGVMEGLGDTLSDTFRPDETPEERAERRAQARKDPLTWLSNAGGGEEGILDAVETLENPEQIAAFEAKMKGLNRESAAETMEAELSTHKLDASKRFLAGDYEGGLSQRMMASADGWIDDDEKGISAGFGKVRLTADEKKEIANLPKDQQAAAQEAMLKAARQRLEGRADEDAKAAGKGSYAEIVESELDEDQKKAERDMRESGQVSEVNQLLEAGNTTLGLGKEAGKFYEILQKKSPKQIDDLAAKFEAENPGLKFKDWVMSKATSAGEKRDFAILVEGNYARMPPEELDALAKDNPEKLIERVKALHEAARAGKDGLDAYNPKAILGNLAGNAMTDAVSGTGATVDARLEKVQALEKKIQGGEKLSDEEREELVKHMRYMAGDQEAFTEAKTATTGVVATVLNKAANVTVTALTGVPELGELAGALAEYDAKDSLNGGRFSADDKISLVIRTGANYGLSKLGLSGGAEGALGGVVDAVADPKKWRDLGQLGTAALENAGTGLITGTIGELGNKAGGDGPLGEVLSSGGTAAANYDPNKSGWDQTKDLGVDLTTGLAKNKAKAHHDAKHRPADDGPDARHAEPDRTPVKEPDAGPTPAPAEVKDVDATPAPAAKHDAAEADATPPVKRDTDEPAKRAETEAAPAPAPVSPEAQRAMDAASKLFDPNKALGKVTEEFHDGVEETYRHPNEELSPAQQTMRQMAEGNANQEGDCTKDSEATRRALAEAGVDATVMNFEPQGGDADAIGHRYVVAPGGVVIDPTFSQMMKPPPGWDPKQPLPSGKLWFEPFSGSYGDMKARVQEAIDHGFMPDVPKGTSAEEVIRKNWGIEPGADGALKFGKDVNRVPRPMSRAAE
jgi:hypothetical protein